MSRLIPLVGKNGQGKFAVVDDEDFEELSRYRWFVSSGYASRSAAPHQVQMHRQVLGLSRGDGLEGDHINRDRLDNRRSNLRVTKRATNAQNLSARAHPKYPAPRGVTYDKNRQKWMATCRVNYRRHYVGRFDSMEEADAAVRAFRAEHHPFSEDAVAA